MLSIIYEGKGERMKEREILLEARKSLPIGNQMLILERLIQVDVDIAEGSEGSVYREEAIALLHEVVSQGWDTYETYDNLAVLYVKQGNLVSAGEILDQMDAQSRADILGKMNTETAAKVAEILKPSE